MIVDRIIQSIANATTPVAFPSSSELDAASESLRTAQVRLDAATALTTNMEHLVEGATQAVLDKFPQAAHFSLSLFAPIPEIESNSLREDINALFRFITYCLLRSGSDHILKKMISEIAHASYTSSELSSAWYVEALKYLKNNHGITGISGEETNAYIEDMINALS